MTGVDTDANADGCRHLREPLASPAAWHGSDLDRTDDWVIAVTPEQAAELTAAGTAGGAVPGTVTRQDFPLPALAGVCRDIRRRLEGGRGVVLLRGVPVTQRTEREAEALLWRLGTHVGTAEPQDRDGRLLHRVQDTGRDIGAADVRYFQTNRDLGFHNDGADAFMLLCVRAAAGGGRSRIVSSVAVFNRIVRRDPELAMVLQQPFHFDLRGQQAEGARPYQTVPVFNFHRGRLCTLYKRQYIDSAQRFAEVPPLTGAQRAALDQLDAACDELAFEFAMRPGDLLIANNYDVLHARSGFADGDDDAGRLMLRLWLTLPGGRPLPPAFAATREFRHSYARHRAWAAGHTAGGQRAAGGQERI